MKGIFLTFEIEFLSFLCIIVTLDGFKINQRKGGTK
jgi:hypothetical protein